MNRFALTCPVAFAAVLILLAAVPASLNAQQGIRVGVVEFQEKNDIGLDNSGVIVAEWVVTAFQQTGRYQVEERLLLEQVLEEQQLMLSGIIDEDQAPKIGELYGVDAILTGSVMRVGSDISVTGRIINVGTGEILRTASVTTGELGQLETEVIVLANELADISRDEWEIREDLKRRESTRLDVGGGFSYGFDNAGYSSLNLDVSIRLDSRWILTWIDGSPVGGFKGIEFGLMVNVIPFLAVGASYGMVFDDAMDFAQSEYLTFGVLGRPRFDMELGIMLGFSTGGLIWTDSGDTGGTRIDPYFTFPGTYQVWYAWRVTDYLMLRVKYTGTSQGNLLEQLGPAYQYPDDEDWEFITGRLSIVAMYSFAIGTGGKR